MKEPQALWMVGHLRPGGVVPLFHTKEDCAAQTNPVASAPGGARVRVHYPWLKVGTGTDQATCVPVAYCEQATGRPLWNYCAFESFSGFTPL